VLASHNPEAIKSITASIEAFVEEAHGEEKADRIKAVLASQCPEAIKPNVAAIKYFVDNGIGDEKDKRIKAVLASHCSEVIKAIAVSIKAFVDNGIGDEKDKRIKAVLASKCSEAIKAITASIEAFVEEAPGEDKADRIKAVLASQRSEAINAIAAHLSWYLESSASEAEFLDRLERVLKSRLIQSQVLGLAPIVIRKNISITGDELHVNKRYQARLMKFKNELARLKARPNVPGYALTFATATNALPTSVGQTTVSGQVRARNQMSGSDTETDDTPTSRRGGYHLHEISPS
jgi:hypothetical protein